jgi:VWFA-related protein
MVLGKNVIWAGTLGLGLGFAVAAASTASAQPPAASQSASSAQQQNIPDAPRPQTLPDLKTITPVGAAITAPEPPPPAEAAPGSALPSSPRQTTKPGEEEAPELPPAGQGPAYTIRTRTNFVEVPFTVKDSHNQQVPGISWRDVRVYENGLRQHIDLFTVDPFPLSVALVIDQSVTFDTMNKINNALLALQGAFTPYDEVAVFTYNNGVKEQTTFTAAQSARLGVILERSKGVGREPLMGLGGPLSQTTVKNGQQIDPNTTPVRGQQGIQLATPKEFHTLNDAILAAAMETTKAERGRRRVVYVVSDGKEYGSKAREKDVIKYCQMNKVAVYATLVGDSAVPVLGFLDRIHLPFTMRDNALVRFTGATGGQVDPEFRQKGIETSFAKITEEVRTQYTVGYYSHEPMLDGKYRKLEVRVARPNLTVISKEGYYPSISDSRPQPTTPSAIP